MTKRELGREFNKKANKLSEVAFGGVDNKNEILKLWDEATKAFEEKRIFKCDMEQIDKTLQQACKWVSFRKMFPKK